MTLKFSYEVPIKYLKELDSEQDYLFIIGHELKNKKYFNYCKNSKKYKILDNSAYELKKSIPNKLLKKYAKEIKANIIILPDILFDRKGSEKLQKEFKKLFNKNERKKYKFMKVVSANNIDDYFEHLYEILYDKDVDIIGISRSRTMITPNLTYIMNWIIDVIDINMKPIHLLGCSHIFELLEAKEWDNIVSIDTGMPINFTFKNKIFPKIKRADKFVRISGENLDTQKKLDVKLAKENIKIFKSYYKNE